MDQCRDFRRPHAAYCLESKNGNYENCDPEFTALAIGVNNFSDNTAEEITEGIKLDLELISKKLPNTKILLFGPLPTGINSTSDQKKKIQ